MQRLVAPTIVWLRLDLRLDDQPALAAAAQSGAPVLPVFIWHPESEAPWSPGAASRWWLHHSLVALQEALHARHSNLIIRTAEPAAALARLVAETGASAVYTTACCEPAHRAAEQRVREALGDRATLTVLDTSLHAPDTLLTRDGRPYRVFGAFARACLAAPPVPFPHATVRLPVPDRWPASTTLDSLDLLPHQPWARGMSHHWQPGERGGHDRLERFLDHGLRTYERDRDRPDLHHTSGLSPHLHFGELSAARVWHLVFHSRADVPYEALPAGHQRFLTQLLWREFARYLLWHYPDTAAEPLRAEFAHLPWRDDADDYRAWCLGQTGYPLVDAGMRQLWRLGWMHNRVRMVAASFLVKDLLLPWQWGARWFWDTEVDADLANNTLGWQWCAGCGADAAPYMRVFNPTLQAQRYDPHGLYIRRWVPELAGLADVELAVPWQAAASARGGTYPRPLVDHAVARARALAAFAQIRRKGL